MTPVVSRAGDRALLLDFGAIPDAWPLHAAAVELRRRDDVLACIVGAQSLYVVFRREPRPDQPFTFAAAVPVAPRRHHLEVRFDGADLEEFLARVGFTRAELLRRVAGLELRARYLGFRAGFAYLDGWPEEWAMPRRPTSRRVPRGSFAIAAAAAGFYPIDSPGGWNLLGTTDAVLWDARRSPPNLIRAGDAIRIVPVERALEPPEILEHVPPPTLPADVLGPFAQVVGAADWSRVEAGISPGGAFDETAAAIANRLVGNEPGAPVLECAMAGPRVRFRRRCLAAWTGATSALPSGRPFVVEGEVGIGRIHGGLRGWLAVGSEAAGPETGSAELNRGDRHVIRIVHGPHETPLRSVVCEVTPQLDRVGIRLRPLEPLPVQAPADLPSCGMQFGTIQLHPDGSLVAMGPDHPITGGYLQPMTVRWDERWKLAQLMPGERVTFAGE